MTQADLNAGSFTNTAEAVGTDPDSNHVQASDLATANADQNPILSLLKEADVEELWSAGDVINYTITVTNDGNIGLTGVTVTDVLLDTLVCAPVLPASLGLVSPERSRPGQRLPLHRQTPWSSRRCFSG